MLCRSGEEGEGGEAGSWSDDKLGKLWKLLYVLHALARSKFRWNEGKQRREDMAAYSTLLEYCGLDMLAMVRMLEGLREILL